MKSIRSLGWFFLLFWIGVAQGAENNEAARIQYLITSVENLQGVKFIRNGQEYEAKKAAEHLRLKLKTAGSRIKTAQDFIRFCASRSSVTGLPYQIRFPDGRLIEAEAYFKNTLTAFPLKGAQ
jgi:hypothetical protein